MLWPPGERYIIKIFLLRLKYFQYQLRGGGQEVLSGRAEGEEILPAGVPSHPLRVLQLPGPLAQLSEETHPEVPQSQSGNFICKFDMF